MKGLGGKVESLRNAVTSLASVSLEQFSGFTTNQLIFRYRKYMRTYKNPDKRHPLDVRKSVAYLLGKLVFQDCPVLLFD